MKITNKFNIPDFVVDTLTKDYYDGKNRDNKTFSATEILGSPCYIWLKRRHQHEVVIDSMSLVYMVQGSLLHMWMDQEFGKYDALTEDRLKYSYNGLVLTGGFDRFDGNGTIWDFKFTTVWSEIYKDKYPKWEQQLNIYAFLLRNIGFEVNKANIIEIFRDWSIGKYQNSQPYPLPIETVPMRVWTMEEQGEFIHKKLEHIASFENVPDEELPPCSMEDRFQSPDKWAVKKNGNKRASAVFDSREDAQSYLDGKGTGYVIEERPSVPNKCIDRYLSQDGTLVNVGYCPYSKWCPWWNKNKEKYS